MARIRIYWITNNLNIMVNICSDILRDIKSNKRSIENNPDTLYSNNQGQKIRFSRYFVAVY